MVCFLQENNDSKALKNYQAIRPESPPLMGLSFISFLNEKKTIKIYMSRYSNKTNGTMSHADFVYKPLFIKSFIFFLTRRKSLQLWA